MIVCLTFAYSHIKDKSQENINTQVHKEAHMPHIYLTRYLTILESFGKWKFFGLENCLDVFEHCPCE